jgi:hypothetical protein
MYENYVKINCISFQTVNELRKMIGAMKKFKSDMDLIEFVFLGHLICVSALENL